VIHAGATLGHRVTVRPGARVGGSGFAFVTGPRGYERLKHVGRCVIGNDVEIGANATVDRGSVGDTVIGEGTKIDNLVQLAHNVRVGRHCLILAQAGVAGSTVIEDDVVVAGQAGLAGHLTVGRGARVAAQAGVIGDVPAGAAVSGYPARSHREVLRQAAALRRMTPLVRRLEELTTDHARSD
jgi:UDP-3-O-[3-hydroxymyristoyl] glucosamine N-acyltransferase